MTAKLLLCQETRKKDRVANLNHVPVDCQNEKLLHRLTTGPFGRRGVSVQSLVEQEGGLERDIVLEIIAPALRRFN